MTRYRVSHRTRYTYDAPVGSCVDLAVMTPRVTPTQRVLVSRLAVDPTPDDTAAHVDLHGNTVTFFAVSTRHVEMVVDAESEVSVEAPARPASDGEGWEQSVVDLTGSRGRAVALGDFALPSPLVPRLGAVADLARPSFEAGRPGPDAVLDLVNRIHTMVVFEPEATTVATPLSEVVEHRRGVCQDFAHLTVGCLRSVGLAARYVSGYVETDPPPGRDRLVGADASHAWCSVWLEGHGWLDLDPTNGVVPTDRHITVAWGRDYADVTPLSGVVFSGGSDQSLTVEVDVVRQAP